MREDVAQGLILGVDGDLPVWDERDDCLVTGRAEYQSWHELCIAEVSCKDVQRRCWIAGKQLVSDVITSDVTSIMDVKNSFAMILRGSDVVPAKSRVDEPLHQKERSARNERCAEQVRDTNAADVSVERVECAEHKISRCTR